MANGSLNVEVYDLKKEKVKWQIVVAAMICLTVLEMFAIANEINGVVLSTVIAILAMLGGLALPTPKLLK
jgi:hypothetical protein